jgi:hypothetical protein
LLLLYIFSKSNTNIFARSQKNFAAAFLQHFDYAVFCMAAARPCYWGQANNYWVLKKPNICEDFAYLLSTVVKFMY